MYYLLVVLNLWSASFVSVHSTFFLCGHFSLWCFYEMVTDTQPALVPVFRPAGSIGRREERHGVWCWVSHHFLLQVPQHFLQPGAELAAPAQTTAGPSASPQRPLQLLLRCHEQIHPQVSCLFEPSFTFHSGNGGLNCKACRICSFQGLRAKRPTLPPVQITAAVPRARALLLPGHQKDHTGLLRHQLGMFLLHSRSFSLTCYCPMFPSRAARYIVSAPTIAFCRIVT